jgi:hypothetical protein
MHDDAEGEMGNANAEFYPTRLTVPVSWHFIYKNYGSMD